MKPALHLFGVKTNPTNGVRYAVFECGHDGCPEVLHQPTGTGNIASDHVIKKAAVAGWLVNGKTVASVRCPRHARAGVANDPDVHLRKLAERMPDAPAAFAHGLPAPVQLVLPGNLVGRPMRITPELAETWLKANEGNRVLRQSKVLELAEMMERGAWRLTHQGVAFSPNGRLLDGQHRLQAIVLSGRTVEMMVTHGIDEDAYKVMDIHGKRSLADNLQKPRGTVELVTFLFKLQRGDLSNKHMAPDHLEAVYPLFAPTVEYLHAGAPTKRRNITSVPVRAAVICRMLQNPSLADYFVKQYHATTLLYFDEMCPKVQAFVRQMVDTNKKMTISEVFARAWLAYDHSNQSDTKIQIKDPSVSVDEGRKVLLRAS